MAGRTAVALVVGKFPKTLPEGITVAQTKRTIGKLPDRPKGTSDEDYEVICLKSDSYLPNHMVDVYRVAENAGALKAAIEWLSGIDGANGGLGIRAGVAAMNNYLAGVVTKLTADNVGDSLTFLPPVSGPRYADPYESLSAVMAEFQRVEGRMPKPSEWPAIYEQAGLAADGSPK